MRARLEEWDGAGAREESASGWLHRWLPTAIVLVSIGAAVMGWQASVADEHATHRDELSRQDLGLQQQARVRRTQEVDADLRLFGEIERYIALETAAEREAELVPTQERPRLLREAQGDHDTVDALTPQLRYQAIEVGNRRVSYNVGRALREAETEDTDLLSLEPNRLHDEAVSQRNMGLHLVGLAVLFVVALVFFTVAAVTSGRSAQETGRPTGGSTAAGLAAETSQEAKQPNTLTLLKGPEAAAYCFAIGGLFTAASAVVLFVLVRWT